MAPLMPVMDAADRVVQVPVPPYVVAAASRLIYAPSRYFEAVPASTTIPIRTLSSVMSDPQASTVPLEKMAAAYEGSHPPRPPITVKAMESGKFLVLDGNSTAAVAIGAGWPSFPCIVHA